MEYINTYAIPEWAVCALEYGDFSGLTEADCVEAHIYGDIEVGSTSFAMMQHLLNTFCPKIEEGTDE